MSADIVIQKLIQTRTALTVTNYLLFSYLGDVQSLDQLAEEYPEDYCEILGLIENGVLVDTKSRSVN